jgi:uncharacterized membrane protein
MDATITPHRSLSPRGFVILMSGLVAVNATMAVYFLAIGAIPIPVFLGIDVLSVYLAFKVSYRAALMAERVQVTASEVRVLHERGRARMTVWRSATAFTNVDVEAAGEPEARVRLRVSGRRWTVAAALSPREREAFADALKGAMHRAKLERW